MDSLDCNYELVAKGTMVVFKWGTYAPRLQKGPWWYMGDVRGDRGKNKLMKRTEVAAQVQEPVPSARVICIQKQSHEIPNKIKRGTKSLGECFVAFGSKNHNLHPLQWYSLFRNETPMPVRTRRPRVLVCLWRYCSIRTPWTQPKNTPPSSVLSNSIPHGHRK